MKTLLIILSLGLFTFTAQATAEETGFVKYTDGAVVIKHPDGRTEKKYPDGAVLIKHPDGRTEKKYPDGTVVREHPDGRTEGKHPDGRKES